MDRRNSLKLIITGAVAAPAVIACLLYTSDAADERSSVDLGGSRIIKKKTINNKKKKQITETAIMSSVVCGATHNNQSIQSTQHVTLSIETLYDYTRPRSSRML